MGRPGVLIEMKKRGVPDLERHFPQARDYWVEMNPELAIGKGAQKPRFILLCDFDQFIIYDYLTKVDVVPLDEMVDRRSAFNYLLFEPRAPIFKHNEVEISIKTANTLGRLYKHLVHDKNESPSGAQRFVLQTVLCMFSEDFELLPQDFLTELILECQQGGNSYDLIGGLYKQMASPDRARGGRFKDIQYFNGGLFDSVKPLELDSQSLDMLALSAESNWKSVNPAIFGSLFESTLEKYERHALGAHFTSEADIRKIVNPTISKPWNDAIDSARSLTELLSLYKLLGDFRVLDPACGCGNFLFVAYQAIRELEQKIIWKIADTFSPQAVRAALSRGSLIRTSNFLGIDIQPIAVEVAKMTMMIAREIAARRWNDFVNELTNYQYLDFDPGLPLDRLDESIVVGDALFIDWPDFDVVIGNPPFQSKNKIQQEMGVELLERVRARYPDVPGLADYCVYWFRRCHDEMRSGQRAGLVGTNTIRQNYSRMGGLDYIASNGGTVTDAVSSQVWSGEADVHVSVVNWIKGDYGGVKQLSVQDGDQVDSPFQFYQLSHINSALSPGVDVTTALVLRANARSKKCYQGQTHGHPAFVLRKAEAEKMLAEEDGYENVIFPYLIGNELLSVVGGHPQRYVIDMHNIDSFVAQAKYPRLFSMLEIEVKASRKTKAESEEERNKLSLERNPRARVNRHHGNFYKRWWQLGYARGELMREISTLKRYIVCVRTTRRPIFEFIDSKIHPNDALQVFPLDDDYSFGILQSELHWNWFCARCSTLKRDFRYTSNTVFDSFPWPQSPSEKLVKAVAKAGSELRKSRAETMRENNWSLRDLYRAMEDGVENPVSNAQDKLDKVVRKTYGIASAIDDLSFLLELNARCAARESIGEEIIEPGLPIDFWNDCTLYSDDCVNIG